MKYSAYLKKFEGLSVMLFSENGICTVIAIGDKAIREAAAEKGAKEMEIKKIYDDFIEFKINGTTEGEWLVITFPLDRVIFNFSNLELSR